MHQYLNALIYILLGLCCGLYFHYLKKRYVDRTTQCTLKEYCLGNFGSTLTAVTSIVLAEITLSTAQVGDWIALPELVGAITTGFSLDSISNVAPDRLQVENTNVELAIAQGLDPAQPTPTAET